MPSKMPLPIGVALLGIGLLLQIFGLATSVWLFGEYEASMGREKKTKRTYGGLWEWCDEDGKTTTCFDLSQNTDETFNHDALGAVRAMTILGVIAGFVALIAATLLLLGKRDKIKHLPLIALCASVAACGFIMIGVIVWGVEIRLSKESKILIHWGYSLVLVLAGHNLMAAGAGVLAYIADFKIPSKIPLPTGVGLLGIGLLLHIIGLATPIWFFREEKHHYGKSMLGPQGPHEKTERENGGIWGQWCFETIINYDGDAIDDTTASHCIDPGQSEGFKKEFNSDALGAIRAMTILGVLAGFVALIAAILHLLGKRDTIKNLPLVALGASVAACGFNMIGVIVWGVEIHIYHWGYSLVLVLAGHNLMAAGAGVLAYIAGNGRNGHLTPQRSDWVVSHPQPSHPTTTQPQSQPQPQPQLQPIQPSSNNRATTSSTAASSV